MVREPVRSGCRLALRSLLVTALGLGALRAQGPESPLPKPKPQDPPATQEPPPKQDPPGTRPPGSTEVDPAKSAGEALRRLLGGETKPPTKPTDLPPNVPVPPGPPPVTPQGNEPATGDPAHPDPALRTSTEPQDPQNPPGGRIDEAEAVRRAMQRGDPNLGPVERPTDEVRDNPGAASDPRLGPAVAEAAPAKPFGDEPQYPVHGFATLEYRHRRTESGDKDEDLRGLFGADLGAPERNTVTFHLLGNASVDLDGIQQDNVFNGTQERYDGLEAHLYEAWADLNRLLPELERVRVGRQVLDDAPEFLFLDGVRVDSATFSDVRAKVGAYGGQGARYYESSSSSQILAGLYGEARPWDRGRVRFDWVHSEDDRGGQDYDDDLLGLALWQGISDFALVHLRHTLLDGRGRDLVVRGDADLEDLGLRATVAYTELLTTQTKHTIEFDPYWDALFDLHPYRQLTLSLGKDLPADFEIEGGLDVRRLDELADEGEFNRDFERYHGTLEWHGMFDGDLVASVTAESWQADGEDETTYSGELAAKLSAEWRASVGTDYSLYKYDMLSQTERDHVRSVFARADYRVGATRARLSYVFENDDYAKYHELEAAVTWSF